MELDKIDNLEILELYKEVNSFSEFLEKTKEQVKKEMENNDE